MDYISVSQARPMRGLRLVLSAHVPGPWGEAAKAVLSARGVPYVPVEQTPFGENTELCEWTGGIRNAPIAMVDDEPPVHGWLDLVMLAERLGSGPSLLPASSTDRALAIGLTAELCARGGFGWERRLLILDNMFGTMPAQDVPPNMQTVLGQYGYSPATVQAARDRLIDILQHFTAQLERQEAKGSRYLVGDAPSVADYHWACFSQMIAPLKLEDQPRMPDYLMEKYSEIDAGTKAALNPRLIAHRDMIYRDHIGLPLDF